MVALKRWEGEAKDHGTFQVGDLGTYHLWRSRCIRFDEETIFIAHIGKTLRQCQTFRDEFVRNGCFCWKKKELCFGVPICPLHPHGICGIDMEMQRAKTEMDGDVLIVFSTMGHCGREELMAKVHPDHSIEYFGYLVQDARAPSSAVRAPGSQEPGGRLFESGGAYQRSGNMRACPDSDTCEVV